MNKLRVLLVAAALLTAACGTTTISGSQVKSFSTSGSARAGAGANAGANAAAQDDLGRPNPTIRKSGPVPVQQPVQPATTGTQPSTPVHDRCTDGMGGSTGPGSRAGASKHPPLPECAVE
jgi:hypothetical protein